jgi:hypothetical protein
MNTVAVTPAERLTQRLDDLASALHRAGIANDAGARLLELAALATLKAVELEVQAAERNAPPASRPAMVRESSALLRAAA